ncbi:MAG: hypothetical protein ACR2NH_09195, partial [Solirubrobacteraceae bacterium]
MRIGFHDPFLPALGGGEKYFLTMLEEATRLEGAELVLFAAERPDPAAWRRLRVDVEPRAFTWVPGGDAAVRGAGDLDLLVVITNDVPPRNTAAHAVAMIQFPFRPAPSPARRLRRRLSAAAGLDRAAPALASYDRFLCYSAFSREHIRVRLGVEDAHVLPPPVDLPAAPPDPRGKDRVILSIGRFFSGFHDKRHDVLIDAFAALHAGAGAADGWELH